MNHLPAADLDFLNAFEGCEIRPANFRHREHVRLAYIYLRLYSFEVAFEKLRTGLQRLLEHLGAPPSAYHETITRAWLLAVAHFIDAGPLTTSSEEFLMRSAVLLDKDIILTHYTKDTLMSPSARTAFVAPDLQPIPTRVGDPKSLSS